MKVSWAFVLHISFAKWRPVGSFSSREISIRKDLIDDLDRYGEATEQIQATNAGKREDWTRVRYYDGDIDGLEGHLIPRVTSPAA